MDEHSTEWGVRSPWGDSPSADLATAQKVAENMRTAGHKATVIWRGVTKWMEEEDE